MILFPAIDLWEGNVVRLTKGDYDRMQVYSNDPLAVAKAFAEAGAAYLHVVDLNGAKSGAPHNMDVIRRLAEQSGLRIQVGGGLRTAERVRMVLELGVFRVILGTAALREPDFLRKALQDHGRAVAVGVDARDGRVAVEGWRETSDTDAMAFCRDLQAMGVQTVIYTDISRDGMLSGANLEAYRRLRDIDGLDVVASGGVSSEADIAALRDMGLYGAIVGKALYENRLDLKRALVLAKKEDPA